MGKQQDSALEGTARDSDTTLHKMQPPQMSTYLLSRPRLDEHLEGALSRRLTTVVGEAGFGKSMALAAWSRLHSSVWYTLSRVDRGLAPFARGLLDVLKPVVPDLPQGLSQVLAGQRGPVGDGDERTRADVFGSILCDLLARNLRDDLVLIFDDVHELGRAGSGVRVIEALCRQGPPLLHVVLASREDLPFAIDRLRGQGQVLEIDGSELLFSLEEVASLIAMSIEEAESLAPDIHRSTGGWPAGIRLTVEALRKIPPGRRHQRIKSFQRPGGPLFVYLAREVYDREPPNIQALIRTVASLEVFTPELCTHLGLTDAPSTIASLERRGLFIETDTTSADWYSLSTLARQFAVDYLQIHKVESARINQAAVAWFEKNGHLEQALRCMISSSPKEDLAGFIKHHAPELLLSGKAEVVAEAFRSLPSELADDRIQELAGEALLICGDWVAALDCYNRCGPKPSPGVAWRTGLIHYLRGELAQALRTFASASEGKGTTRDEALLLAWTASVHWARGELEPCRMNATESIHLASSLNDDQALAAAHISCALLAALEGDRVANDQHYKQALVHAERAGDVLQTLRIHTNLGSFYMEQGYYEESLAETEIALRLADLVDYSAYRAMCLTNRGEVRLHLGDIDEAISDLEMAKSLYQRSGSRHVAYALEKLGHVYYERGDSALARAAYEEALIQAENANDAQGLVPALAGLARVMIRDDPGRASDLSQRAISCGAGMSYVAALNSAGRVALATGVQGRARELADEAMQSARLRRDRAGMAEALEVKALSSEDVDTAVRLLNEAGSIWRDLKNPIAEARVQIEKAKVFPSNESLSAAKRAKRAMKLTGARGYLVAAPDIVPTSGEATKRDLEIQTLGGFSIMRREGSPVHQSDWQSRKARDLLKILVARRSNPAPRDILNAWLWPDEDDPTRLSNRCSVALATVRSVLDPAKRYEPDHFIISTRESIGLDLRHITIDVETFIAEAGAGFEALSMGDFSVAKGHLMAAETTYAGDFLEQDAYVDWAVPLREEARNIYARVARTLAREAMKNSDPSAAQNYLLRILERDPFDEEAHLELISALTATRRHGEARRAYRTYCTRMKVIGVEAASFPGTDLERTVRS